MPLHLPVLPFLFLLFLLHLTPVCEGLSYRFNISEIKEGEFIGRIYSQSTNNPLSSSLYNGTSYPSSILSLYPLLSRFRDIAEARLNGSDPSACNMDVSSPWIRASTRAALVRQVGNITTECPMLINLDSTLPHANNEIEYEYANRIPRIIRSGLSAMYDAAIANLSYLPPQNWSTPHRYFDFKEREAGQMCRLDSLFAYFIRGQWYILSAVTNHPLAKYVEDYQRQVIHEYLPPPATRTPLYLPLKRQSDDKFELATTYLLRSSGQAMRSATANLDVFNRRAPMGLAARANYVPVDLADDALTVSNIALLALPMVMNLIPVAAIADVNVLATIVYVVFTDICSTIPFAIKGIELVEMERRVVSKVAAYALGNTSFSQMEVFVADCRPNVTYRNTGIGFIVTACVAVVVGMVLEITAEIMVRKGKASIFGKRFKPVPYVFGGGERQARDGFHGEIVADAIQQQIQMQMKANVRGENKQE